MLLLLLLLLLLMVMVVFLPDRKYEVLYVRRISRISPDKVLHAPFRATFCSGRRLGGGGGRLAFDVLRFVQVGAFCQKDEAIAEVVNVVSVHALESPMQSLVKHGSCLTSIFLKRKGEICYTRCHAISTGSRYRH